MDTMAIINSVLALIFVLALVGLVSILLKKYGAVKINTPSQERKKRLFIVDAVVIDAKRKLVLIKRDDTEHLIMLGHDRETIIESGINKDT